MRSLSSGKKKHWRLSTPFQTLSQKQDPKSNAKVGRSGSRVSSVYLSDDSSASGFVIIPEFDYPVATQAAPEGSTHYSGPNLPSALTDLESVGSYLSEGSFEDDLAQRLGVAYDHIRSMPPATSPRVSLSSDPQTLRKQLGVAQHSVFNHSIPSSPDLPNPYPPSPKPMSPLPPTSLGVSATTPRKPSLRINTDIGVRSTPSPELIFPEQSRSVTTEPTRENSPSQHSTPESPSAPIVYTSTSQDTIQNPLKLSKRRRATKATYSSPSQPVGRQPPRGVLRKQNTPSSVNVHKRQTSLPQVRPPSPFRVNIPLHHAWHDRRTDFNSSPKCHSDVTQYHEKNMRRTSGSTEVLASLAWIGTLHTADWRRHLDIPELFPDHFDMGTAVEDDNISDGDLVDRLERVRRINGLSERSGNVSSPSNFLSLIGNENASLLPSSPSSPDQLVQPCNIPSSPRISEDTTSDSDDAEVWQAARKAFLCIREIVRTEKKYQEALQMLLNAQTTTPPPPSMPPYVSALVRVSELLLKRFLEDPSAWGVSTAFVTSEDELEASMVSWCTIAGSFFTDNDSQLNGSTARRRLRKSGLMPNPSPIVTKQTPASLSPQLPPVFSMISSPDRRMAGKRCTPPTHTEKQTAPLQQPENTNKPAPTGQPPSRKLSVRDLAIQPIQRVMRYVLLYRDLLSCTPAMSPPRLLVERALEAATRIASNCDKAQRNPAFCPAS